jgi:hypothetical protein
MTYATIRTAEPWSVGSVAVTLLIVALVVVLVVRSGR